MPPVLLLAFSARAAVVSGTVRALPGGEVIAGVTILALDPRLDSVETTTASDGSWSIDLPLGTWRFYAWPPPGENRVPRFHPSEREWCDGATVTVEAEDDRVTGVDLALPEGATLSGTLRDTAGEPVEDAIVVAFGAEESVDGLYRYVRTGLRGTFEIGGIDAPAGGEAAWVVGVDVEGWPEQYLGPTYDAAKGATWTVGEQGAVDVGEHVLLDGITVSGTVRGPDGALGGATVYVYSNSQVVTVTAGADGAYEAVGLPPGDVLPWTSAEGHGMTYYPDTDRPETFIEAHDEGETVEGADLDAPYEAVFRARFADAESGETLYGVTGLLYNDTHTVGRGDSAQDDGELVIDRLFGGEYELYVWAADSGHTDDWVRGEDGEARRFVVADASDDGPFEIALQPAALLSGSVAGEGGGAVNGAVVLARRDDGEVASATTGPDGTWSIGGLPGGTWTVDAQVEVWCPSDPGYVHAYWEGEVNPDWQAALALGPGDRLDQMDFVLPSDDDHDGMGDGWEDGWGLDTSRDDSAEDPDGDGLTNLEEYLLGTNPVEKARACGCGGGKAALLPLLVVGLRRRRTA